MKASNVAGILSELAGNESCRPESVTVPGGVWTDCNSSDLASLDGVEKCDGNTCEFSPAGGGMGAVYVDGTLTPYAAALSILKHAQGCRRLEVTKKVASDLSAANVSVLAWQSSADSRFASVLLTNLDRYNTGPLPATRDFFSSGSTSGVAGVSRLIQRDSAGIEVDGLGGLASEVQLEGFVVDALHFCRDGDSSLPALEPFQTVLLAIPYDEGEGSFDAWLAIAIACLFLLFPLACLVYQRLHVRETKNEVTEDGSKDANRVKGECR